MVNYKKWKKTLTYFGLFFEGNLWQKTCRFGWTRLAQAGFVTLDSVTIAINHEAEITVTFIATVPHTLLH